MKKTVVCIEKNLHSIQDTELLRGVLRLFISDIFKNQFDQIFVYEKLKKKPNFIGHSLFTSYIGLLSV